ncbi:helix-turn-helix domain-containing protein [Pseudonocardia sp. NPDC049154]|uniref:PucR family transcriptional regulator n=1 Tax=Pseudonocardia sp. NPDC049154 TaxID=3155501 RepID=UPI0033D96C13
MPVATEALLTEVAGRLTADTDELVARQLAALRRHPAYDPVPQDDLRRSCRRNVQRVVATLTDRPALSGIEEDERESGQRRARQGVPADAVVEAYRAVMAVLRDAFVDAASESGADPRAVLAVATRLWDLTDRYSGVLVSARQQVEIDSARRDERRRITFVQRLLGGGIDAAELGTVGAAHGLRTGERYRVVRARDPLDPHRMARHLEHRDARALIAPLDGDVVGLLTTLPEPLADSVIAVAGPVTLAEVGGAFADATRVLTVALRYGRTGVVDSSSLSVRVAVEQERELGEQLHRRYLADLLSGGLGSVALVETVARWLREQRSVQATARALSVHENTVRYRLSRFAETVGANLADTDVLVEVWWALEYAHIRSE